MLTVKGSRQQVVFDVGASDTPADLAAELTEELDLDRSVEAIRDLASLIGAAISLDDIDALAADAAVALSRGALSRHAGADAAARPADAAEPATAEPATAEPAAKPDDTPTASGASGTPPSSSVCAATPATGRAGATAGLLIHAAPESPQRLSSGSRSGSRRFSVGEVGSPTLCVDGDMPIGLQESELAMLRRMLAQAKAEAREYELARHGFGR